MTLAAPARVAFTRHAERRARERRLDLHNVAESLLSQHDQPRRNPGEADWLIHARGIVIAYNWPDGGDETTAVVISAGARSLGAADGIRELLHHRW
jgi:hypothetical protein